MRVLLSFLFLSASALLGADATFFPAEQVNKGFEKGGSLLDRGAYHIMTAHRDGPGLVEVHALDTDIFHVIRGSATLLVGGAVVGGKTTAPNEVRGEKIEGGKEQKVQAGDVIVIPNETPHWFRDVDGPFDYYVVKVRACAK